MYKINFRVVRNPSLFILINITGNGSLLAALLSQQSARVRNPLLIGLCIADLLVCACSGPLVAARPSLTPELVLAQHCDSTLCSILTCLEVIRY